MSESMMSPLAAPSNNSTSPSGRTSAIAGWLEIWNRVKISAASSLICGNVNP